MFHDVPLWNVMFIKQRNLILKMIEEKKQTKKVYYVRIGEKLKECLELQKKVIEENTYGVLKNESYYNAGEILAKKILENSNIF